MTGGAEIVRRYAGRDERRPALVELEQVLVGPHVGAVVRDEDGDVADDGDPALAGLGSKRAPLVEEHELTEDVKVDLLGQLQMCARQGVRVAVAQLGGPLGPIATVVILERREEREIVEPTRLGRPKLIELLAALRSLTLKSSVQHLTLERQQLTVVVTVGGQAGQVREVVQGEQAPIDQGLRRDQQRVSGKRRRAGIRRVAEAGRPER